jgi:microcin C transport system ATP-binding protein
VAEVFDRPQHPYTRTCSRPSRRAGRPPPIPTAPEILRLDDLKVHFPIKRGVLRRTVGYVKAVDGVSIALREGHTIGLVGESGSGKTTLGLALLRLERSTGGIRFDGKGPAGAQPARHPPAAPQMQIVFQDPFSSLSPRMSVGADRRRRARGARHRHAGRAHRMIDDALREVGLDPAARERYRTNSPAASASASRSPARWCSSRASSCSTSRPRRST